MIGKPLPVDAQSAEIDDQTHLQEQEYGISSTVTATLQVLKYTEFV